MDLLDFLGLLTTDQLPQKFRLLFLIKKLLIRTRGKGSFYQTLNYNRCPEGCYLSAPMDSALTLTSSFGQLDSLLLSVFLRLEESAPTISFLSKPNLSDVWKNIFLYAVSCSSYSEGLIFFEGVSIIPSDSFIISFTVPCLSSFSLIWAFYFSLSTRAAFYFSCSNVIFWLCMIEDISSLSFSSASCCLLYWQNWKVVNPLFIKQMCSRFRFSSRNQKIAMQQAMTQTAMISPQQLSHSICAVRQKAPARKQLMQHHVEAIITMNTLQFLAPIQLLIQMQWWSKPYTQRLHCLQWRTSWLTSVLQLSHSHRSALFLVRYRRWLILHCTMSESEGSTVEHTAPDTTTTPSSTENTAVKAVRASEARWGRTSTQKMTAWVATMTQLQIWVKQGRRVNELIAEYPRGSQLGGMQVPTVRLQLIAREFYLNTQYEFDLSFTYIVYLSKFTIRFQDIHLDLQTAVKINLGIVLLIPKPSIILIISRRIEQSTLLELCYHFQSIQK